MTSAKGIQSHLKFSKIKGVLAGHIVAMVTYRATKLTATCFPMFGQFVDIMILASTSIMTHQTVSLEKYWKLFSATLRTYYNDLGSAACTL